MQQGGSMALTLNRFIKPHPFNHVSNVSLLQSFFPSVSHPHSISLGHGQCLSQFKIKPCPGLLKKSMTVFINFSPKDLDLDLLCHSCAMHKRKANQGEKKKYFPCYFLFALIEIIIKILIGTDSLEINCCIRV